MQSSCSNESLIKPDTLLMWAYAAHAFRIFPFTRKDTKGVSKGLPLRYPLGEVTVKVGGANQNDAPSP